MLKRLLIVLLLVLVSASHAQSTFTSQDDLQKWVTYYYLNPEPHKVPAAVQYLSQSGMLDRENPVPPILGFLAGAFQNNPDQLSSWLDELSSLPEPHLGIVLIGLWYAELPNSGERVHSTLENYPSLAEQYEFIAHGDPIGVTEIPLEQGPWVLDVLWGNFMATGDKQPIIRIMAALPWENVEGDVNRLMVGGAANWSLSSNARQHEKVRQICEEEVNHQPEEVAQKLRAVLDGLSE